MRCVFDTNTLISALLFKNSVPGKALYSALASGTILISAETIRELAEVIDRPKFDRYLTIEERAEFLGALLAQVELIEVSEDAKLCRDPKDDKFLNLASSGAADYLVTGDEDLLILQAHKDTHILKPRDFLELLI